MALNQSGNNFSGKKVILSLLNSGVVKKLLILSICLIQGLPLFQGLGTKLRKIGTTLTLYKFCFFIIVPFAQTQLENKEQKFDCVSQRGGV